MKPVFILKSEAREVMRTSQPRMIYVSAVYLLLCFVLSFLSMNLLNSRISYSDVLYFMQAMEKGNLERAMVMAEHINPPVGMQFIDLLIRIVTEILAIGFLIFVMSSIRHTQPCYGNLLDGFGMPLRIILLNFLMYLFIALWSLLFFIPGIIAAYRYRFAVYLLIDHPEYSPMQCLRESKRLTYGHKWELFSLDLSFFGWFLLSAIPYLGNIVSIWLSPYYHSTCVLFYEQLSTRPFYTEWEPQR